VKLMLPGTVRDAAVGAEGGWRRRAACRREDPELFFPIGTIGPARARIAATKAVCAAARSEAGPRFALSNYGIWGGLTEDERRNLRRRPRAAGARPQALRTAADWPDKDSAGSPPRSPLARPTLAGRHRSRRQARAGQETVSRLG
jgi:WhiB family redox-sensing transcriptional regulator